MRLSTKTLARREELILMLRRSLYDRERDVAKLEAKVQRAEAWSARSEALQEKLIHLEMQVDKLSSEKSHINMQLARAQDLLAEKQVATMHKKSEADSHMRRLQHDFDTRIQALRKEHRFELEKALKEVSDAMKKNTEENAVSKQRMLDAEIKYDTQSHELDRVKYQYQVLLAENKSMRQRLNEIEDHNKYKKAGNRFLDAIRAAKAAKAAKAAADAAAALALLQAQQNSERKSPEPSTTAEERERNSQSNNGDHENRSGNMAEVQNNVMQDIEDHRDQARHGASRTENDQPQLVNFLDTDSEENGGGPECYDSDKRDKHVHLTRQYMRTRRVAMPVGRLGPTGLYVQAMSYFRPAHQPLKWHRYKRCWLSALRKRSPSVRRGS